MEVKLTLLEFTDVALKPFRKPVQYLGNLEMTLIHGAYDCSDIKQAMTGNCDHQISSH